MFTSVVVPLAFAASALGAIYLTSPTSGTTYNGGQEATLTWIDSGTGPSLGDFGLCSFDVMVGNALQQTPLQSIATGVNVAGQSSITFTVDPSIGPTSNEYFIRVTSESLHDPSDPQFFAEVFSSKFNMAGMSGSFNASIQAEINGQSTAPIGGSSTSSASSATSSASGSSTSTPATTTGSMTTSMTGSMTGSMSGMSMPMPTSTGASTSSTAAGPSSTNGAGRPVLATGLVVLVATLVGAALL